MTSAGRLVPELTDLSPDKITPHLLLYFSAPRRKILSYRQKTGSLRMIPAQSTPAHMFAPSAVETVRCADGSLLVRSKHPLEKTARCVGEYLEHWSALTPDRSFLMERSHSGAWQGITYAEALKRVRRVAAFLLSQGLSAERPVVILSENSVEHAVLTLACLHGGIPVAPVSPAYSLLSSDFAKLKKIVGTLQPGLIYAGDARRFRSALTAISPLHTAIVVTAAGQESVSDAGRASLGFDRLLDAPLDAAAVTGAFQAITPQTIAKFMFTSGSTDEPKAVINTHQMLCSNQQAIAQVWPFLSHAPVLVDWLPWHHTFGGNHNFNLVLRNGGTLYIDSSQPVSTQFQGTLANLAEVAPTVFFNVPRAYDLLVRALQKDAALRAQFFSRLQLLFYAAASLPQHLWDALEALALETLGRKVPIVSSWGLTETAPAATSCHFLANRSGVIGVPVPGCELKLVPSGDKLEARVRGPNVTPGYWKRPDLTAAAFDEQGFFKTGDAVQFVDVTRPELGLRFDGRLGEDFKLTTGTWVSVGALRLEAIAALEPVAQDVVVAGHDRDEIGFLIFPNIEACRGLCAGADPDACAAALLRHPYVRARVVAGLQALKAKGRGSSMYAARALLLDEPPSADTGEITDKGYINQRAVLSRRADAVERLYRNPADSDVMVLLQPNPSA
jgi:feruloyl-CoA synthase